MSTLAVVLCIPAACLVYLALGVLWNRVAEKRAERAELPLEWRRTIERTYGKRHD